MNIKHAWDTGARVMTDRLMDHIRALGKTSPGRRDLLAKKMQTELASVH